MYQGIYTPSITILKTDGSIDYPNMQKHIDKLIDGGVNGILFFGSIGEFYAFTQDEKKAFIDFAVKTVANRVTVIVGTGGMIMDEVIDLTHYAGNAGADAAMLISPYYFGPTEQTAIKYFSEVASAVDLPLFLYNFPARTGSDLTPDLVLQLATRHPNIIGIKDTVDCISHTRKIIQKVKTERPDFTVLSGFDEYYVVNRISGGDGILSGLTNIEPGLFADLHKAYANHDFEAVERCAEKVSLLMKLYDVAEFFVAGMKASVKIKGLDITSDTKEPSVGVTAEQYEELRSILKEAGSM